MVSYHHVQYQKKLMIQSCENLLTGRRTDRRANRRKRVNSQEAVRLTSGVQQNIQIQIRSFGKLYINQIFKLDSEFLGWIFMLK